MAQFYKATPNCTTLNEIVKFIFIENEDKENLELIKHFLDDKFIDGCTLTPVDEDDSEFQLYVRTDIIQVQKDIDKLELLKKRLRNSLR